MLKQNYALQCDMLYYGLYHAQSTESSENTEEGVARGWRCLQIFQT